MNICEAGVECAMDICMIPEEKRAHCTGWNPVSASMSDIELVAYALRRFQHVATLLWCRAPAFDLELAQSAIEAQERIKEAATREECRGQG